MLHHGCQSLHVCVIIQRADCKFSMDSGKASSLYSTCLEPESTPHAMRNVSRMNVFGGKRASRNKHLSSLATVRES